MKYLENQKKELTSLKSGMEKYDTVWTGQTETVAIVDTCMTENEAAQADVRLAEENLVIKRRTARVLEISTSLLIDTIVNKAIGFHTKDPISLVDYSIKLRQPPTKKPQPSQALLAEIKDDIDGQGFILSTTVDPNADRYEWYKGVAADAEDIDTTPPMQLYKSTSKTTFVDDNVVKGLRYFYNVRAINAAGDGPMSPVVSRVQ